MRTLGDRLVYLDIDEDRSSVDIYYVNPHENATPDVELDVQFTYLDELCQYIEEKHPHGRYIFPDKFLSPGKRTYPYYSVSHTIHLNDRELLKILNYRAKIFDGLKGKDRPSYPKHYEIPYGYENPYKPIPRDQPPITG